jgi:hypothetical protein
MQIQKLAGLTTLLVLAYAGSAMAQFAQPGAGSPPEREGYIGFFGGAASGPPAEPVFSVEFGDDIRRNVLAYLTLSYVENVMPQVLRDDLAATATFLTGLTGARWELTGRDRAVILVAGGKYLVGRGDVQPYVGGGAGIINLKRFVIERNLGDLTIAAFNDFDAGTPELSLAPAGITRPLVEAAVGVGISKGPTYVDIGYRYRRALRLAETLDFGQFSVGIGYRW